MPDDPGKLVSFKVDAELGDVLDNVPNRSDFIRKAILAQFQMICPLCTGKGVVPSGLGEHYGSVFREHREVICKSCGTKGQVPADRSAIPAAETQLWAWFFRGEPFLCGKCFAAKSSG